MPNEILLADLLEVNTDEKLTDYLKLQSDFLFYELLNDINESEKDMKDEVR